MTSLTRAFQGADAGRLDLGAVAGALGERYTIDRAPARVVRLRRLDTADASGFQSAVLRNPRLHGVPLRRNLENP